MKDRHIRKFINYLEKRKREREARWKAEEEAEEKRRE